MVRGSATVVPGVMTPTWKMSDACIACDEEKQKADPTPEEVGTRKYGKGSAGQGCAGLSAKSASGSFGRTGSGNCRSATCAKYLETPGQMRAGGKPVAFSHAACKAMAAREGCEAAVWYAGSSSSLSATAPFHYPPPKKGPKPQQKQFKQGSVCICVQKSSCCKGCSPTRSSGAHLYRAGGRNLDISSLPEEEGSENASESSISITPEEQEQEDEDKAVALAQSGEAHEETEEDDEDEEEGGRYTGPMRREELEEYIHTDGGLEECEGEQFPEFTEIWNASSPNARALTRRKARRNNLLGITSGFKYGKSLGRHRHTDFSRASPVTQPPAVTLAQESSDLDVGVNTSCVRKGSIPADCSNCLENDQCADGVCDPIMKKCVMDRLQRCDTPIADCNPPCPGARCSSCKRYGSSWQKPTCGGGGGGPPAPPPPPAPEGKRRRRRGGKGGRRRRKSV